MDVLVATTSIGHLSPVETALLVSEAWSERTPAARVRPLPMSAGGAGFLGAVEASTGGRRVILPVRGPDGQDRPASVLLRDTDSGLVAYIEAAEAAGGACDGDQQSYGVGQLLLAARETGARQVVVGVGDLVTVDGGAGMLRALAGDTSGSRWELPDQLAEVAASWHGIELVAAVAHDTPLLGAQGATHGAAGRLGLDAGTAEQWERAMGGLIDGVERAVPPRRDLLSGLPVRLHRTPGAGEGGGLAFALLALGATVRSGAEVLAETVGLEQRVRAADVVVTGESTYDWRSLQHSVVATVSAVAAAAARPVVLLAREQHVGRRESMSLGVAGAYSVIPTGRLMTQTPDAPDLDEALRALAARVARTWTPESTGGRD